MVNKTRFLSIVNNTSPIQEVRMKQRSELWVTNDILKSIKERDKAFCDFKKHITEDTFSILKSFGTKPKIFFQMPKEIILRTN